MKITISASMLTSAQWGWVLSNVRQEYAFTSDDVRVCVTFEHPDGIEHAHRELEVREFLRLIGQLSALSRTAEALLTPDALPDVYMSEVNLKCQEPACVHFGDPRFGEGACPAGHAITPGSLPPVWPPYDH